MSDRAVTASHQRNRPARSPSTTSSSDHAVARAHPASTVRVMERRIFGLENEYGVTCTLRGQRRLSPDEVARYLFRRVGSWGRSRNGFLRNAAALYPGVGGHSADPTPGGD